ncbi:MAG: hypothetical protein DWQ02_18930 [Bacteroidetes bacterium]|nr:MAG: hypothetical protein DWQ02_18930 [Bacteroidota bacterium]
MIDEKVLYFIEYDLQAIALIFMAVMYSIKAYQLSKLPMPWEKAEKKGSPGRGVRSSYAAIFMPWSMESSRKHIWRWLGFALYHVGALVAIVNTFTYPFAPDMMTRPVRVVFAILIAPAAIVGLLKLIHRLSTKALRVISTPDDYFSLVTLEFFFVFGVLALWTDAPLWRMLYFLVTAFFLFYVPFSKISHYVYFFFARYLTGKRYGWRGVIPLKKS